jgi:hypothetical protein
MSSYGSSLNDLTSESILTVSDCLTLDKSSLHSSKHKDHKLSKYSKKLNNINFLVQDLQNSLISCSEKTEKYSLNSLKSSNKTIQHENLELKKKITQLEEAQKLVRPLISKAQSNTSLRTQATDWFLSKEMSFSVSSCSSDSIMILNDQVEHVKELKKPNTDKKRMNHNHHLSRPVRSASYLEHFFKDMKRKLSFGSWKSEDCEIEETIDRKGKFVNLAIFGNLPAFKF